MVFPSLEVAKLDLLCHHTTKAQISILVCINRFFYALSHPKGILIMATRRRIGVSIASTEAARRQLMQPVPCWEKVWVTSSVGSSSLKVYKWVKTEKVQVNISKLRSSSVCTHIYYEAIR